MDFLSKILAILFSVFTALGIMPKNIPAAVTLRELEKEEILITQGDYDFSYNEGRFSVAYKGATMFLDAVSEYKLEGKTVSSAQYDSFNLESEAVSDARGEGTRVTATLTDEELPAMKQTFTFYNNKDYFQEKLRQPDG